MNRKRLAAAAAIGVVVLGVYWMTHAGNLEPPGAPASTMVTLSDLDAKLSSLVAAHNLPNRFVGVTSATTTGLAGFKGMGDLCRSQFAGTYPNVRMCFSEEIMRTPPAQWPALGGNYWVQPTFQAAVAQPPYVLDISGYYSTMDNLTCTAWNSNSSSVFGLVVTVIGSFVVYPCDNAFGVTCCAP